jgi:hypothetical protein
MKILHNSRKHYYLAIVSTFLITLAFIAGTVSCSCNGGGGGDGDVVEIQTWHDLDAVRNNLEGSYVLMENLDDTTDGYDELVGDTVDGKGWQPIGAEGNAFKGEFDGNGHTISDLFIDRPDEEEVGLFGRIQEGVIENVGLVSVDVTGKKYVGALVGYSWKGTVDSDIRPPGSNTYSRGSVTGEENVGGLVGNNYDGTVNQCESSVEVFLASSAPDEDRWRTGGLVGLNSGTVLHCDYNGVVNGDRQVGGLVGLNEDLVTIVGHVEDCGGEYSVNGNLEVGGVAGRNMGDIRRSSFTGEVNGIMIGDGLVALNEGFNVNAYSPDTEIPGSYVGGVVGVNEGTVEDCSAEATVEGYQYVGGLAGANDGTVEDCSADSKVTGESNVGGLVGANGGTLDNCSSSGDVTGDVDVGRLVGYNTGTVSNSDSTSWVTGTSDGGDLIGRDATSVSYNLHVASTSGGSVTSPGEGTFAYNEGEVINLVATPSPLCRFVSWTGNVGTVANINAASTTITMNGNYSITANFVALHDLTISSTEGGSVTTPGEGTYTYDEGTVVNLVAEADKRYRFENWTGDVNTIADINAASTTITMNGYYSIAANFAPLENLGIWDWYDLDAIRNNLGDSYVLMNNLDSTTAGYWELACMKANGGKGWQPIGIFTGSFDGQGYEIRDLFIDRPGVSTVGLFVNVGAGGVIQNVGVVNADVTADSWVGGLVGWNGGTVSNSYSIGSVNGLSCVGGLVGINFGIVSNSYSMGSVTGNAHAGGLVGLNEGTVSSSYSTGSVTGGEYVGGLVGGNDGMVSNSYSIGSVAGDADVGGLVGLNEGSVSNSFWDTQTSGQATSVGGTGKTTAEMKDITTFSGAAWNIIAVANVDTRNTQYIWNIVDGQTYPFLSWES